MNNAANSPVLRLENVTKKFDDVEAVSDLSFSLDRSRVLALLGPNDAGKTTIVEMCEGAIRSDEGRIRILDLDPVTQITALRSRIGVMLQGGGAYPGVRVGEMLNPVVNYPADLLDIDWPPEVVGLERHCKTNYRRLSGDQQQRLSLACALVGRPELMLLDELAADLDAQPRLAVQDFVPLLRRDGVTVVLAAHLMDEAEPFADDVAIIDQGHLAVVGTIEEVTSAGTSALQGTSSSTAMKISVRDSLDFEEASRSFSESGLSQRLQRSGGGESSLIGEASLRALTVLAQNCEQ